MGRKTIREKRIWSNIRGLFLLSRSICRQRELLYINVKNVSTVLACAFIKNKHIIRTYLFYFQLQLGTGVIAHIRKISNLNFIENSSK